MEIRDLWPRLRREGLGLGGNRGKGKLILWLAKNASEKGDIGLGQNLHWAEIWAFSKMAEFVFVF